MTLHNRKKIIVMSATGIALVLGLARCTPLNSNIDKDLLRHGYGADLGSLKQNPKSEPLVSLEAQAHLISKYKTKVLDVKSYFDLRDRMSAEADEKQIGIELQVLELTSAQVDDLREHRRTVVVFGEAVPAEAEVYANVSLPRAVVSRAEYASFKTEMRKLADGSWELSIPRQQDPDMERLDETVLANLEGVIISVRTAAKKDAEDSDLSVEEEAGKASRKPVLKPLGLEPRIRSANAIQSLETSRQLLRLISSSQAL